jgi:hypothetical protein
MAFNTPSKAMTPEELFIESLRIAKDLATYNSNGIGTGFVVKKIKCLVVIK